MFGHLEALMLSYINTLPLEAFVFIASFIEEVVAPVPSAAVLLLTGSFAAIQERPLLALIPLAIIAAVGKNYRSHSRLLFFGKNRQCRTHKVWWIF